MTTCAFSYRPQPFCKRCDDTGYLPGLMGFGGPTTRLRCQCRSADDAVKAELAAIAERSAQAKRANRAAIALFHDMRRAGAYVGRVNERTADGRFAADDE